MKTFLLPDLGEGLPDGEIVAWHVTEGQEIKTDAPLVSIETAKAIVEVPSPYTGKIIKLYGKVGEVIPTGGPLVDFMLNKENAATVAGEIQVGNEILIEKATTIAGGHAQVLPAVRALAKKMNVDLSLISGTGKDGHITLEDVKNANEKLNAIGPVESIKGLRRTMAIAMANSHSQVVPVTIFDDADITAWVKQKDFTVKIMLALVKAIGEEKVINQWYDGQAVGRRIFSHVNIGVAIDTQDGLFVPVLKEAQSKNHAQLKEELALLKKEVIARTIQTSKFEGATILLSNFGKFSGRYATPIVVPPTICTIGVGAWQDTPKVVEGEIKIRSTLPISLTFDHRALTGGEATRFLSCLIKHLQAA